MQDVLKQARQGKIAEKAAALWGADPDSLKLISVDNNLLFHMKCESGKYYMRITHPLIHSAEELKAAIHYQHYLFEKEAPICQPIASLHAAFVEIIPHHHSAFLVYVNEAVQGDAIYFDHADQEIYKVWGKALAHLHRAAKSYPRGRHQFLYWHDLWEETGRFAIHEDEIIQREYQAIDTWVNNLSKNQHDFGLIHGKHQPGKIFYDGEKIHLLDTNEPVYHWFHADIARPFLDLPPEKFDQWKTKAACFLDGYCTIHSFDEEYIQYLPWFIRMKILDEYLRMKNMPALSGLEMIRLRELRARIRDPLRVWEL